MPAPGQSVDVAELADALRHYADMELLRFVVILPVFLFTLLPAQVRQLIIVSPSKSTKNTENA